MKKDKKQTRKNGYPKFGLFMMIGITLGTIAGAKVLGNVYVGVFLGMIFALFLTYIDIKSM